VAAGGRAIKQRRVVTELELWQEKQKSVAMARAAIATVCVSIIEDPDENGYRLAELHEMYPEGKGSKKLPNNATVKKLLLLSQLAVFKDIIPGYRISHVDNPDVHLSKEVRQQRELEQGLLTHYQMFLQRLHREANALNKEDGRVHASKVEVAVVAVQCMCELLVTVHHFNFATNIVSTLIPLCDNSRKKITRMCCGALETLFQTATYSAAVVSAVRSIDQYAYARQYRMQPNMLNCLLALRLTEDADEKLRKEKKRDAQRRQEMVDKNKNRGKNGKNKGVKNHGKTTTDAELERDMAEGDAVMAVEDRRLAQAATSGTASAQTRLRPPLASR